MKSTGRWAGSVRYSLVDIMIPEIPSNHQRLFEPKEIFGVTKPVVAMLHLDPLPGQPNFVSHERVYQRALEDLIKLQTGGVNGILIENWKEDSLTAETSPMTAEGMLAIVKSLRTNIRVPFGINVLNNDYATAFRIASETDAQFVELDILVDLVRTNFEYSELGKNNPFEIMVDVYDVAFKRRQFSATEIPLLAFIQPKHYIMLESDKSIETSAIEAAAAGADGVLITKATGKAPDIEKIWQVKRALNGIIPVGMGSGFSVDILNAAGFAKAADYFVVGSALKIDGDADNPVDLKRVTSLMDFMKAFQS